MPVEIITGAGMSMPEERSDLWKKRMKTIIKTKIKKSDDQTNIDKCRVASNSTEYYILSKLIFLRIIISKLMKIRWGNYFM